MIMIKKGLTQLKKIECCLRIKNIYIQNEKLTFLILLMQLIFTGRLREP